MSQEKFAERVERGAKFLDGVKPGWFDEIDTDRLSMRWTKSCVLGQLYGTFFDAVPILWPGKRGHHAATEHGFTAESSDVKPGLHFEEIDVILADLWRAEVRARLAAAGEGTPS